MEGIHILRSRPMDGLSGRHSARSLRGTAGVRRVPLPLNERWLRILAIMVNELVKTGRKSYK